MSRPRPNAVVLILVLAAGLLAPAGADVALAREPRPVCTGWTDQFHPPPTIRVLRKTGPNAGLVETVDFWTYVAYVLKAEYSSGYGTSTAWMRIGAITVKQFAWYYAMFWRGGKAADGSCYDVRDSTADQLYRPERMNNGVWEPANVPTPDNYVAMAETWHMSLRKWNPKNGSSRLFLTGYRSGKKRPCGSDAKGFKIMQKSLRDCSTKNLTLEEIMRRYFEPRLELVNVRDHDILADGGQWLGDLGVLAPNASATTDWRLYPGLPEGFGPPVAGSFALDSQTIVGHGAGDVTGDALVDLVMLTNSARLLLAPANGAGYGELAGYDVPAGAPTERLLVADFNGDLLADVGLLRSTPTAPTPDLPATLVVLPAVPGGTFGAPVDWWRGALDLAVNRVYADDVNGDGRADLVIRDDSAGVREWVAPSFAACLDFSAVGPCTISQGAGLDVAQLWFDAPGWGGANVAQTFTDFNRDGRADLVFVMRTEAGVDVYGAPAVPTGGFSLLGPMWQGAFAFDDIVPVGLNVNSDALGDLALLYRDGTTTSLIWLRTEGAGTWMSPVGAINDPTLNWSTTATRPY